MTDRIKYNEETGKVEVDVDVWNMIANQIPGNCIIDEVKTKELWDDKASRVIMAQHLNINHNKQYNRKMFTGVKNKFILSGACPDCVISLNSTIRSKNEFRKTALTGISKADLQKMKDGTNTSIQSIINGLLSGAIYNPKVATVAIMSKITGVPIHRFIWSTLPDTASREMARIKQIALTEKTNILATVMRELKVTGMGLAQALNVSQNSVSYWQRTVSPRLNAHVALCKYFNVPFDYFSDWLE